VKIAITGHTAGIGQALAQIYAVRGHEIVGLSKRDGHNIRSIPKIADLIEPCDMFVNNAQAGFAQTELLFEMCRRWHNTNKPIMVISTMMMLAPVSPIPGADEYYVQKQALEQACTQLRYQKHNITVVKPGAIATQPGQTVPPYADVKQWAQTLVEIFDLAQTSNLIVPDISLGPVYDS
jgi:nucleoside-diphosphate-sugar epimerase